MNSTKSILILAICLIFIKSVSAQSFLKIPATIKDKTAVQFILPMDDNVGNLELYKNIPSKYKDFNFKYLYVDPVQGVYEKLMLEANEPEKWQRFKTRFSVPDGLKIYPKKLLNNKLAVFYALDENQNAIVIFDKNGNNDLSDDEIHVIDRAQLPVPGKGQIFTKRINLDIPIELYNEKLNSVKDTTVNLDLMTELNSSKPSSSKDLIVSFKNGNNLTAEVKTADLRYVFSWVSLVTPNRIFIAPITPVHLEVFDKNNKSLSYWMHSIGDTVVVDNYKSVIREYNTEHLILEKGVKENIGYTVGQTLKPTSGVDIFNPDKKIELVSKRYLVIDFWATWCGPCIAAMPELIALEKKYKGKVDLVSVIHETKENVELAKKIVNEKKLTWPQIWDDRSNSIIAKPMKIHVLPSMVVVDKDKKIVFSTSKIKELEEFLEKAN